MDKSIIRQKLQDYIKMADDKKVNGQFFFLSIIKKKRTLNP